jgi:anti-sigma factor RsiW
LGQVVGSLPGDATQVSTELADTLGISIALPRELPSGFSFAGGRTIRPDNIEAAHLAWSDGKTMLSFYEAADPGGDPPANWRQVQVQVSVGERSFWYAPSDGEHAVLWRGAGTLYLLVADLPEETLLQTALSANPIPQH